MTIITVTVIDQLYPTDYFIVPIHMHLMTLYEVSWGDLSVTFEQAIIYNLDSEYYILLNPTIKGLRIYACCNVKDVLKCYLELWCLTSLTTIFQLYCGGQFYWWRKPEYPEKTTDLPQDTDKLLSHNVVSSLPSPSGIRTHNVSGNMHWLYR